ncbi:hypothetical protein cgR_2705 [Corynebacterium glutamicum R]|uniref:Uncharacterized protein n=1 Tax=Corynebacterium glutamicum (strain R) TaxID=340322 RepID=A0AB72VE21_CORGB|nr:hypothetical protein cgR_2705 [Corynebacterium glutamicum R]
MGRDGPPGPRSPSNCLNCFSAFEKSPPDLFEAGTFAFHLARPIHHINQHCHCQSGDHKTKRNQRIGIHDADVHPGENSKQEDNERLNNGPSLKIFFHGNHLFLNAQNQALSPELQLPHPNSISFRLKVT